MKAVCALLLLFLACSAAIARELSVDELMKHAKEFDGQRVTTRGIVEDGGNKLFIYADLRARTHVDTQRGFVAFLDPKLPPFPGTHYGHYAYTNACWVKITGVVDTRLKRWRDDPFGLQVETVEVISSRIRTLLDPLGYFRNETGRQIRLQGFYGSGGIVTGVAPHGHTDNVIEKGLTFSVLSGKREIAKFGPMTEKQWKKYFDPRKKAYYFRITENGIALVRPENARDWHWDPDPQRD